MELADTIVLGIIASAWGFESLNGHQNKEVILMFFKKSQRNEKPRYESIYFDNKDLVHALSDCVSLIVCTIEKNGHPIKRIMLNDGRCFDERKHGKWVVAGNTTHYYICSVCGKPGDCFDNYCRSCGARMVEK